MEVALLRDQYSAHSIQEAYGKLCQAIELINDIRHHDDQNRLHHTLSGLEIFRKKLHEDYGMKVLSKYANHS